MSQLYTDCIYISKPFRQGGRFLILYGNIKCPRYVWEAIVTNVQMPDFPQKNWDLRSKYLVYRAKTGISDRKTRFFTKHQITRKVLRISFGNRNFRSFSVLNCNFRFLHYDLRFWFQHYIFRFQLATIVKIRLAQSKEWDVIDDRFSRMQLTCHVK